MNIATELGFFDPTNNTVQLQTKFRRNSICWKLAKHLNGLTFDEPSRLPLIQNQHGVPLALADVRQALNRISRVWGLGGYTTGIDAEPTPNHPDPDHQTKYIIITVYRPEEPTTP
jgi:hypothetical protein|tara:strand:- start:235 stop:579 length:345 start_codon:yes stop_codon:yes gene_type:complete